jgi:hypothetical protein
MTPTFWQKFIGSFDNITKWAFSARKLTAFTIISCIVAGHFVYYKHCLLTEDFSIYTTVLAIDYIASGFFLGIITFQQILQFKNGSSSQQTEQ